MKRLTRNSTLPVILCLPLVLSLIWSGPVSADTRFTYQGQLNHSGQPHGQTVGMVFTLHDAPAGGNQLGPQLAKSVTPVSGLFQVELDFGNQPYGAGLWLETSVNGATLSPRQELTGVPLAINARDSARLGGSVPGAFAPAPTLQSKWWSCSGPTMLVQDSTKSTHVINTSTIDYRGTSSTGLTAFFCDVNLPDGAQIMEFKAVLRDTAANPSDGLARCFIHVTPMSGPNIGQTTIISSVATGSQSSPNPIIRNIFVSASALGNPVNNGEFTYRTTCDVSVSGSATIGQMGIFSAAIRYRTLFVPGT